MNEAIIVRFETECEIPCVKVETHDHSDFGYLMPFRAYRFQVCGNVEGECDLGSSDVKNFREQLKWMPESVGINRLREQAIIAIMRWLPENCKYGVSMSKDDADIFEEFIQNSYDWVKSLG
jgi:uncharacterized cysteine cluster protein YcgN (CxxCxxCC family)